MTDKFNKLASIALKEALSRRQNHSLSELENKLKEINQTISKYPAPIPKCDAQFNGLLDERDKLQKDIAKIMQTKKEFGGPEGPEPTRYGDWENKGITYDF